MWLCGGDAGGVGDTVEVEIEKPKTLKALGVLVDESFVLIILLMRALDLE